MKLFWRLFFFYQKNINMCGLFLFFVRFYLLLHKTNLSQSTRFAIQRLWKPSSRFYFSRAKRTRFNFCSYTSTCILNCFLLFHHVPLLRVWLCNLSKLWHQLQHQYILEWLPQGATVFLSEETVKDWLYSSTSMLLQICVTTL